MISAFTGELSAFESLSIDITTFAKHPIVIRRPVNDMSQMTNLSTHMSSECGTVNNQSDIEINHLNNTKDRIRLIEPRRSPRTRRTRRKPSRLTIPGTSHSIDTALVILCLCKFFLMGKLSPCSTLHAWFWFRCLATCRWSCLVCFWSPTLVPSSLLPLRR